MVAHVALPSAVSTPTGQALGRQRWVCGPVANRLPSAIEARQAPRRSTPSIWWKRVDQPLSPDEAAALRPAQGAELGLNDVGFILARHLNAHSTTGQALGRAAPWLTTTGGVHSTDMALGTAPQGGRPFPNVDHLNEIPCFVQPRAALPPYQVDGGPRPDPRSAGRRTIPPGDLFTP